MLISTFAFADVTDDASKEAPPAQAAFYVKKNTFAETMAATRENLKSNYFDQAPKDEPNVFYSDWEINGPIPGGFDDNTITPNSTMRANEWKKLPKKYADGKVFDFDSEAHVNRFLRRTLTADRAGEIVGSFGSDDGIKIWLNGKLIHQHNVEGGAVPGEEIVPLPLKKGDNELFLKINNGGDISAFYFSKHTPPKPFSALVKQLWGDFPHETDWFFQDNETYRGRGKEAGFDARGDFEAYFDSNRSAELEQKLIANVLKEVPELAGETKKLEGLKAGDVKWLETYFKLCKARRAKRLEPLLEKMDEVIFAKHQTFGVSSLMYLQTETDGLREGHSSLDIIDLRPERKGAFATDSMLLDAGDGIMRDPELHFDGERLLFAWRKTTESVGTTFTHATATKNYQIYEYNLKTKAIKQLTDDTTYGASFEPTWMPNDDIMFNSARIVQDVTCGFGNCANLFLMDQNGRYARRIGFDQTNNSKPILLPNGTVVYTRRDYNDRGQTAAHGIFKMNPDGTSQLEYYGNNTVIPNSFQHTRPIPGTHKTLSVIGGYHTSQGGKLVMIDPTKADNGFEGLTCVPSGEPLTLETYPLQRRDWYGKFGDQYSTPYPLDTRGFLCSYDPIGTHAVIPSGTFTAKNDRGELGKIYHKIYYMDYTGKRELLAADITIPCHQAIPVMKQKRPPVRPSLVDYTRDDGVMYVQNVCFGQSLKGVPKGTVKKLRVVEILYKPASFTGSNCGPITKEYGGHGHSVLPVGVPSATFDAKKILGTATVYPDGSAMFRVPARTPIYLQALDENGRVVQTMRSWATLMPGENLSCVGCHEKKNEVPQSTSSRTMAMKKGVEELTPFYGEPRGFSFIKEIQPILDKHCISCHAPGKKAAKIDLTDTIVDTDFSQHTPGLNFLQSYLTLMNSKREMDVINQMRDVGRGDFKYVKFFPRLAIQTLQEPYTFGSNVSKLTEMIDNKHGKVELNREEKEKIAAWIDLGAPMIGAYDESNNWPEENLKFYQERLALRKANEAIDAKNINSYIEGGQR